jgi:hypothetical protein
MPALCLTETPIQDGMMANLSTNAQIPTLEFQ